MADAPQYQMTKDKLKLREWNYTGTIAVVEVVDPKIHPEDSVCHALVLTTNHKADNGSIVLWFIGTLKKYFRRGYATKLIEHLQGLFDEIVTQWGTEAGNALMLKCGFKKVDNQLIWRKGDEDADGKKQG